MPKKRRTPRRHTVHPSHSRYNVNQYPRGTLFAPPKYKKYAQLVSFENPEQAKHSAQGLELEYDTATTKAKRLRIIRVTSLAMNRAQASSKRKALSAKERQQLRHIAATYGVALRYMKDSYLEKHHKPPRSLKKKGKNTIFYNGRWWSWSYSQRHWYLERGIMYEDSGRVTTIRRG